MTAYNNWRSPVCNQAGYISDNNRLTKYSPIKNVADSAIRAFPHLFQLKFFHPLFIGGNGGTFYTYAKFFNSIGSVNSHLVIGLVAVFYAQVIIFNIQFQVGENKFFLDKLPDNPCHFIAIQFYYRVGHFYFCCHIKIGLLICRKPTGIEAIGQSDLSYRMQACEKIHLDDFLMSVNSTLQICLLSF